jgi:hypothetical protein
VDTDERVEQRDRCCTLPLYRTRPPRTAHGPAPQGSRHAGS